jgi:hypothetical protein
MLSPETLLKRAYGRALGLWRNGSARGRSIARMRAKTDGLLDTLGRSTPHRFEGTVLIDGMWDNPNFWLRFALLRAAFGLAQGREIGVLGAFRSRQCRATFERLGISTIESFPHIGVPADVDRRAAELVAQTRSAEDILSWELPDGVHPAIIYDGILKRQRLASVDIKHARFKSQVAEGLRAIEQSRQLLKTHRCDLVIITHPLNYPYGVLAWQALARKVPVVLCWGLFGVPRFTRMKEPQDLFRFYDRPTRAEIDGLSSGKADALATIGRSYLADRFGGRADDLASIYAFQRHSDRVDRGEICRRFEWDPTTPIIGFYASNWYDWPHQLGMTQFRDFLDWTQATFKAARANARVNWLFKPHPAEDWFGGVGLAEIAGSFKRAPHIALADKSWSNTSVMSAIDALVTYHGTAGIEFASLGKPVLVPDRGKYHDCGFVKLAHSRAHYLELLASQWWSDVDLANTKRRAEIFAGLFFCAPAWQGQFVVPDDSQQDALYDVIPDLLRENAATVSREIATIREWWHSAHPFYHTSKMLRAEAYGLTNIS